VVRNQPSGAVNSAVFLENMVRDSGSNGLPVVVSSGEEYLPMVAYTPPAARGNLVAIPDPTRALSYRETDTTDKELTILPGFWSVNVQEFDRFVPAHCRFLLFFKRRPCLVAGKARAEHLFSARAPYAAGSYLVPGGTKGRVAPDS
jgi:hypothetical protein